MRDFLIDCLHDAWCQPSHVRYLPLEFFLHVPGVVMWEKWLQRTDNSSGLGQLLVLCSGPFHFPQKGDASLAAPRLVFQHIDRYRQLDFVDEVKSVP